MIIFSTLDPVATPPTAVFRFKHLLSLLLLDEPLRTTYISLGQPANSSVFTLKNLFRVLGFIFALIATIANGVDAFNIALLNVFGGMNQGFLLYALCSVIAITVSLLYIWQEGRSIFNGTAKLPSLFAKWSIKPPALPKAPSRLTNSERLRYGLFRFLTAFIVFITSIFWSASVFAGVVALMTLSAASGDAISIFTIFTGALGSVAPYVLALATLASISQFASCFFQEGTNFMKRVEKDLAQLLKINHIVFNSTHDVTREADLNAAPSLDDASSEDDASSQDDASSASPETTPGLALLTEHASPRAPISPDSNDRKERIRRVSRIDRRRPTSPLDLGHAATVGGEAQSAAAVPSAAYAAPAQSVGSAHWMVVRNAGPAALDLSGEEDLVPVTPILYPDGFMASAATLTSPVSALLTAGTFSLYDDRRDETRSLRGYTLGSGRLTTARHGDGVEDDTSAGEAAASTVNAGGVETTAHPEPVGRVTSILCAI